MSSIWKEKIEKYFLDKNNVNKWSKDKLVNFAEIVFDTYEKDFVNDQMKKSHRRALMGLNVVMKRLRWNYNTKVAILNYEFYEDGLMWFSDEVTFDFKNIETKKDILIPKDAFLWLRDNEHIIIDILDLDYPKNVIKIRWPRYPIKLGVDMYEKKL